jgi:hypothetical protein
MVETVLSANTINTTPLTTASLPPLPLRITLDGMNASEASRIEVRAWLARLGALTATMRGGHVAIESIETIRKETLYRVHMELAMPAGNVIVASDHPHNGAHEDIYVAIRNGFRAARRRLENYFLEHPADETAAPAAAVPTEPAGTTQA